MGRATRFSCWIRLFLPDHELHQHLRKIDCSPGLPDYGGDLGGYTSGGDGDRVWLSIWGLWVHVSIRNRSWSDTRVIATKVGDQSLTLWAATWIKERIA